MFLEDLNLLSSEGVQLVSDKGEKIRREKRAKGVDGLGQDV